MAETIGKLTVGSAVIGLEKQKSQAVGTHQEWCDFAYFPGVCFRTSSGETPTPSSPSIV